VYAHRFSGKRFDCGSKLGYLQATVEHALAHPELSVPFRDYLTRLMRSRAKPKRKAAARRKGR